MKILVTGSNGYIGKSIITYLSDDYKIVPISREIIDLSNTEKVDNFFKDNIFDVVIHCAFVGGNRLVEDKDCVYEQNIKMFNNLYKNKNRFSKLIYFGSGIELTECDKPYCESKKIIRKKILKTDGFFNIRVFAVFDENELDRRFIKSCLNTVLKNKPILIDKNKLIDFFYMGDLIKLIKFYIKNQTPPKEIDCSYIKKYTLLDIANIINDITGKKNIKIIKDEMDKSYVGNGLFLKDLSLDLIGLKEGIIRTYKKML